MANLKEIRNRISSIGSTMQITSAMKMVSAAKLKRAQDAIIAMSPYVEKTNEIIQKITAVLNGSVNSAYAATRPVKKTLIVAITSNKGLCGGFNSGIVKDVQNYIDEYDQENIAVAAIGKKGRDVLSKLHTLSFENTAIFETLNFENASVIAQELMEGYVRGDFDRIILVYNHFVNAAVHQVKRDQFLPIETQNNGDAPQATHNNTDYIFEPGKAEIVENLIPKALKMQLFKVLRDSFASEHGARMTAMHKATDNAENLKSDLTLSYNKARQAVITAEILEIVGGAEALNS